MAVPSEAKWHYRRALLLAAIALALGMRSRRFNGPIGTSLTVGAAVMAFLAAVAFWQTWLRRRR